MAPFKSTQSISVGKFVQTFRNRDAAGPAALNSPVRTDRTVPFDATGGTKIPAATAGNGYTYHVFHTNGTFAQAAEAGSGSIDVLIVAGGGAGGGRYYSGGGGAGGVVSSNSSITFTGSASVTVGNGGAATGEDTRGNIGSDSSFGSVTAKGGGGGGSYNTNGVGGAGGSSGGSSGYHLAPANRTAATSQPVPSDYTAYGNAGGGGANPQGYAGGGGGGASAVGYDGGQPSRPTARGGDGGAGKAFPAFPGPIIAPAVPNPGPFGTAVGPTGLYGGGGGGANYYNTPGDPAGGAGGGGRGAGPDTGSTDSAVAGVDHTGGGGGGANYYPGNAGKAGGKGLVVVRYQSG